MSNSYLKTEVEFLQITTLLDTPYNSFRILFKLVIFSKVLQIDWFLLICHKTFLFSSWRTNLMQKCWWAPVIRHVGICKKKPISSTSPLSLEIFACSKVRWIWKSEWNFTIQLVLDEYRNKKQSNSCSEYNSRMARTGMLYHSERKTQGWSLRALHNDFFQRIRRFFLFFFPIAVVIEMPFTLYLLHSVFTRVGYRTYSDTR